MGGATPMIATYTIELQRTRDGWVWGIDQTVEEGPAAHIPSRYEDGETAFPTAAAAAADAERRIAAIEAGEHRRLT
jgi:hypothetical protein